MLAWWQLAALAFIVVVIGKILLVAYRNGWTYLTERGREFWWERPRPLAAWRSQDLWQRRRQSLIGLAVATVVAMLLAIALRGFFVPVFVMTLALLVLAIVFGVARGAIELRRGPQTVARELADLGPEVQLRTGPYAETGIFADRGAVPKITVGPVDGPPLAVDSDETPLMFQPLGIDPVPPAEQTETDESSTSPTDSSTTDAAPPPSFSAAPAVGRYQASARARYRKRRQARPIYIESILDVDNADDGSSSDTGKAAGER